MVTVSRATVTGPTSLLRRSTLLSVSAALRTWGEYLWSLGRVVFQPEVSQLLCDDMRVQLICRKLRKPLVVGSTFVE
jgi:hypothetical protein